jgi:hypothetical protein
MAQMKLPAFYLLDPISNNILILYFIQDPNYNPCAERWKNMKEELTNKMWGVFDETGVFMAFCRHGFTLILMDMVRSGEQ